jgi:type IV pilus assembly protein PilN
VYLRSIKQTGTKVNITGYAQSNARVSTLMRNLGASPYLENPELIEIKAVPAPDKSGNRVNEFNMNISIKRAQPEEAGAGGKQTKPGAKK